MITEQLQKDLNYTYEKLSDDEGEKLSESTILITGSAGFIGFYLVHFLYAFRDKLRLKKVICLDNFMLGEPGWQKEIAEDERFVVKGTTSFPIGWKRFPKRQRLTSSFTWLPSRRRRFTDCTRLKRLMRIYGAFGDFLIFIRKRI